MNIIIVALLSAFLAAFFTGRKERNILIEKWINNLRDEVSRYLGLCEQLRLLNTVDFSSPIYSSLLSSMYRIELLLKKEDNDDNLQNKLLEAIKSLQKSADLKNFNSFQLLEKKVINYTYSILDEHWKDINSELKNPILYKIKQVCCFLKNLVSKKL